jgi:NAD(P)-dependent dehydrogenase (short-subunit alcohol dehydrogenase family)
MRLLTAIGVVVLSAHAVAQSAPGAMPLQGKVVMVTGSTDGLGREVALRSAALGATVIVHGRNQERGNAVVSAIAKAGRGSARFYAADFASLAEVRALAQAIDRDYQRLDVLVNNAGIWIRDRQVSKDGHELHFAVNYLAGFLLTRSLLPKIVASAPSRIVNVSSGSASPIDFTDVMLERPGRASLGYGQSKLAQVLFTIDLAAELRGRNVIVTALHPATMMDTTLVRQAGGRAMSTVDEGATAVMQQITGDVEPGQFYNGLRPGRPHPQANDEAARSRLRQLSLQLTGLDK